MRDAHALTDYRLSRAIYDLVAVFMAGEPPNDARVQLDALLRERSRRLRHPVFDRLLARERGLGRRNRPVKPPGELARLTRDSLDRAIKQEVAAIMTGAATPETRRRLERLQAEFSRRLRHPAWDHLDALSRARGRATGGLLARP